MKLKVQFGRDEPWVVMIRLRSASGCSSPSQRDPIRLNPSNLAAEARVNPVRELSRQRPATSDTMQARQPLP